MKRHQLVYYRSYPLKFQSVFIIFNILLVIFLAILCLSPAIFLGSQVLPVFWKSNWYLFLILVFILAGFDGFYFTNRKLYTLLEKEDWPALVNYLEERVIRQGKYSPRLVRLLANTYFILSDSAAVMSLENKAASAKPSLVDNNALVFGTARILGRDISGAIRFFETRRNRVKPSLRPWVCWYYGFALLLDKQYEKASQEFIGLAKTCRDGVITGLSAYFLGNTLKNSIPQADPALEAAANEGLERVRKVLPSRKDWTKETARINAEIHTAVLSKYMEETGQWLYKEKGK